MGQAPFELIAGALEVATTAQAVMWRAALG